MYSFFYPVPSHCYSSCLKMWYTCHRIGSERDGREACNILHAAGPSKVLLYHNILNPLRPMILSLLWIWESNLCTMVNYHLSIAILQCWSWSTFCTRVATFLVFCNWSYLLIKKKILIFDYKCVQVNEATIFVWYQYLVKMITQACDFNAYW